MPTPPASTPIRVTRYPLLPVAFAAAGLLRIGARAVDATRLDYVATPLATILVIAIAWTDPGDEGDSYRRFVLAGLVFSLAGDVYLMLPGDRFLAGLVAFLFAHVSYTVAFTRDGGFTGSPVVTLPFAIGGSLVMTAILPGIGDVALPVFLYALVLLTMAMQAVERWRRHAHAGARLAACGAVAFAISDATLGIARFAGGFPGSELVVAASYLTAQYLIARSSGARWLSRQRAAQVS